MFVDNTYCYYFVAYASRWVEERWGWEKGWERGGEEVGGEIDVLGLADDVGVSEDFVGVDVTVPVVVVVVDQL